MLHLSKVPIDGAHVTDICYIYQLETGQATKTDEFSVNFQKFILQILDLYRAFFVPFQQQLREEGVKGLFEFFQKIIRIGGPACPLLSKIYILIIVVIYSFEV